MNLRGRLDAYIHRLQVGQLRLAMLALVLMMGVTVVDVFSRFVFNKPIQGSYDLVESMLLIFVFHGLGAVFIKQQHIVIDLIDTILSERMVAFLIWIANTLTVGLLVVFGWAMINPALNAYRYGDENLELGLPLYLLWIVALLGLGGAILSAIIAFQGRDLANPLDEPFE